MFALRRVFLILNRRPPPIRDGFCSSRRVQIAEASSRPAPSRTGGLETLIYLNVRKGIHKRTQLSSNNRIRKHNPRIGRAAENSSRAMPASPGLTDEEIMLTGLNLCLSERRPETKRGDPIVVSPPGSEGLQVVDWVYSRNLRVSSVVTPRPANRSSPQRRWKPRSLVTTGMNNSIR